MIAQSVDFSIPTDLRNTLKSLRIRSLVLGLIGAGLMAAGMFVSPFQFYRSYLWAFIYVVALSVGPLAWLMLQYLTGGSWGVVIRRTCEAATRTLPLVALMFVPVIIGIPNLYEWSHANVMAQDPVLKAKTAYLNVPFFIGRGVIYFFGWILLSLLLNKWSAREDQGGAEIAHRKLGRISGPGVVFWGFSVTFMAIDWVMSINPHWFSTIFGLMFMAGQGLTSMAFLITVMVMLSKYRPMSDVLTPRHLHDLGKLMFALVMVWGYFSFSQFLIIWAGNLPEEIPWYLNRLQGGWQYVGILLMVGHFGLPFALLLSRDLKRNFKLLSGISVFIMLMRLIDLYWLVIPEYRQAAFGISWMDFAAPLGLIGIWLSYFFLQLEKRPLIPLNDINLEGALQHGRE